MKQLSYTLVGQGEAVLPCVEAGQDRGSGVLLLHALMGRASTWWREMRWLSEFTRVVAIDQRGHGDAVVAEEPDWSRTAFVADATAVIGERRLAPAVVIGHSMGGINAMCLASTHPDLVKALVLVDQSPRAPRNQAQWKADVAKWPSTFVSLQEAEQFFAPDGAYVTKSIVADRGHYRLLMSPEQLLAIRKPWDDHDHWADYESITCPILIVGGGRSMGSNDLAGEMLRRNSHAQYVEIPGAGHFVHYDAPEAFRDVVEPFVRAQLN